MPNPKPIMPEHILIGPTFHCFECIEDIPASRLYWVDDFAGWACTPCIENVLDCPKHDASLLEFMLKEGEIIELTPPEISLAILTLSTESDSKGIANLKRRMEKFARRHPGESMLFLPSRNKVDPHSSG